MSDTRNNDGRPETRASRPFRYCQCLRLRPQLPLAVRGQGFDPPQLHQCNQQFRSRNKFRKFPTSDFGSNETLFRRDSGIRSLASSVLFPVIDGRRSRPQPRLDRHRPGSRHHAYSDEVDHRFRGCFSHPPSEEWISQRLSVQEGGESEVQLLSLAGSVLPPPSCFGFPATQGNKAV